MQSVSIKHLGRYWPWALGFVVPIAVFLSFYPQYLRNQTFFWVCLITLPLSVKRSTEEHNSLPYMLGLLVGSVSLILPTTIGLYVLVCFILLVVLQSVTGRLQHTLIFHLLLASPLFTYFSSLLSFPLRLQLSSIVATLLELAGANVHIEGNLVHFEGSSFLVDEACAGLFMLGYGLLFGTICLSHLSSNKSLSIKWLAGGYLLLLGLILAGNVTRIGLLIIFKITPENWFHEGIGLLIFALQVLVPFYVVVNWFFSRLSKSTLRISTETVFPFRKYTVLFILFLALIIRHQTNYSSNDPVNLSSLKLSGFKVTKTAGGVTKLWNEKTLIYIKPPVAAYRADHNPMICWQGSGYSFKKIEKWPLKELEVNHAELIKDKKKLYTAWWFESTKSRTGDQLEWRKLSLLNGADFHLVNITCNTKTELENQIKTMLDENSIRKLLTQNQKT